MRNRCWILVYWIVALLPLFVMTGIGTIMVTQTLGTDFANWWVLTTPKLLFITVIAVVIGTIFGIPLAKALTQFETTLTTKGILESFGITAIGVSLTLIFTLFRRSTSAGSDLFIGGYAATILFLTFILHIAVACIRNR